MRFIGLLQKCKLIGFKSLQDHNLKMKPLEFQGVSCFYGLISPTFPQPTKKKSIVNFNQARQKFKATDGIMQMDLEELYPLYVQCRTDAGIPDQDGKYFEEFIIVIKEILNDAQLQHHSPSP